ncbi:nucleotidyltransferase domain-containing protein [Pseudokineococcus basanitobsidens]|uniref:Nucleotidyltransferase domain-containing protein n=1 Tax=Pseudokineococcus basanitobsidens TaxID=1926649 RepID=A0ABU8RMZ6_9ACTN
MQQPTLASRRLRAALVSRRADVDEVLERYGAGNLRMFGSAARGDAGDESDLDLLVDLAPSSGNELLRIAGLSEELSDLLGVRVDVVARTLLRAEVSATVIDDAVAV